jgi:hypothetical protein
VFAPGLLRGESEDPMEMMQNSKHEIKFVASLFKHLISVQTKSTMLPALLNDLR